MAVRAAAKRPMILAVGIFDGQVVDGGQAQSHQAVFVELPVLVAVGAEPVSRVIVPFVGEADGDAVIGKGPEFLDEAVIQLFGPLALEKGDDLSASMKEL